MGHQAAASAQGLQQTSSAAFPHGANDYVKDQGTTELLRSLGLSMDTLVDQSPANSSSSSTYNYIPPAQSGGSGTFATADSVFDSLFSGTDLITNDYWQGYPTY